MTARGSSRRGTRRWPRSRPSATPSSPAGSGVCMATSGPGAIHLLNGLYDAKLDHVPVVAIVGQTDRSAMGGTYQQEVDLLSAVQGRRERLPAEVDRPRAAAQRARPGHPHRARPARADRDHHPGRRAGAGLRARRRTRSRWCRPALGLALAATPCRPTTDARAAPPRCSTRARRSRSWSARAPAGRAAEVEQVADAARRRASPRRCWARTCCPTSCRTSPASIGLLGTRPSYELMRDCDTLLIVGSSFPYTQFLPEFGQARAVQIDLDAALIGMRYPYEVNLVGDAADDAARRCSRCWTARPTGPGARAIEANVARWWETDGAARPWSRPTRSTRCGSFAELSPRLPDDAIVTADSGSAANWYARHLRIRGRHARLAVRHAGHDGPGRAVRDRREVRPPRPAGDRPRRRRRDADERHGRADHHRAVLARRGPTRGWSSRVLHNNDLNQVTWEMRAMGGAPKFEESQALPDVSYADFAASLGLAGDRGRQARRRRARLGPGAGRGPARRARRALRPRRPADPAARHVRADERRGRGDPRGRRGPLGRDAPRASRPRCRSSCRTRTAAKPMTATSAVEGTRGRRWSSVHRADRRPGRRRHPDWDATTIVVVAGARRRDHRHRLDLRAGRLRGRRRRPPAPTSSWAAPPATSRAAFDRHGAARCATRAASAPSGYAISAVDVALWDLKARLLGLPLHRLLGAVRDDGARLRQRRLHHLRRHASWPHQLDRLGARPGHPARQDQDRRGVGHRASRATSPGCAQARDVDRRRRRAVRRRQRRLRPQAGGARDGRRRPTCDVRWFEEPVSSDDLVGLRDGPRRGRCRRHGRRVRLRPPLLRSGCAPRARSTACRPTPPAAAGITEWLRVAAVAAAHQPGDLRRTARRTCTPTSPPPRPTCATSSGSTTTSASRRLLFDGTLDPAGGVIRPDPQAAGHGLSLRHDAVERFRVGTLEATRP